MWHPDIPLEYRNAIVTGDARELAKRLPDESVDLIFTDPPYPAEYLYTFEWLANEARRILKPGGSLFCLTGQYHFDKVFRYFSEKLDYYWLNCHYFFTFHTYYNFPRKVQSRWKPILWFTKGPREAGAFTNDGISDSIRDKRFHEWGQPEQWAFYWIDTVASNGDVVLDPFVGAGTVAAVCKQLDRNYIAFEIDPDTAERARQRVANTNPPLFVLEPQQLEFGYDR